MANYATLKAAIQAAIKQNGNNEITGNLLQAQLLSMINSLGAGYQFVGVADVTTNPGTPDQRVFYIAFQNGTYFNFDGAVLNIGEIGIFYYSTSWNAIVRNIVNGVGLISAFPFSDIVNARAVDSSGVIISSSIRYRLVKFPIQYRGKYRVCFNISRGNPFGLWKYTDAGYSENPSNIPLPSSDEIITLEPGYYIVFWYSDALDSTHIPNECMLYRMDCCVAEIDGSYNLLTSRPVFEKILSGKIIETENGTHDFDYKLVSGEKYIIYWISGTGNASVSGIRADGTRQNLVASVSSALYRHVITAESDFIQLSYYSNPPITFGILHVGSLDEKIANLEIDYSELGVKMESVEETAENLLYVVGDPVDIYRQAAAGSYVGPWEFFKKFKAGNYRATNNVNSYTSLVFYDSNNDEIIRFNSLPRGVTTNFVLSRDAVRVAGYSSNTQYGLVELSIIRAESIIDQLDYLNNQKGILQLNPREQYDNLIANNVRSRRIEGSIKKIFSFVHFSDIHGNTENIKRLDEYVKRYSNYFDDIVCTGDIVGDVYTNENPLNDFPKILQVVGNHDAWIRTYDGELVDYQQTTNIWVVKSIYCYNKFIAPNVSDWGVIQPVNAAEDGKCYYYKDYSQGDTKLRLIVLDALHYGVGQDLVNDQSVQNQWFVETLASAKAAGIPVVIGVHYWPAYVSYDDPEVIKCSYTTTDGIASDYLPSMAIDAVQSFIDGGGEFVCWFVGHAHCDVLAVPRNYPQQMFIAVDCGTQVNSVGNAARITGEKSQDCFNFIAFDTYDKLVKVVRIGCDKVRQLTQKRVLVYRYKDFTDEYGTTHNKGLEISE